jgi:hypothetical protein
MADLAEIQAAYYMVAATGVLVAAVYYVFNMRATQRNMKANLETRQTQLFMQIYMRYMEPDLIGSVGPLMRREWRDLDDYIKKYGFGEIGPDGINLGSLFSFYEGVAVLLQRGTIDIDLVYELMPTNVTVLWRKYGPLYKQVRVEWGMPQLMRLVEYLSDRLAEHARLRGDPVVTEYRVGKSGE